jgi:L,D-transpeptidase ErfK/SrfK
MHYLMIIFVVFSIWFSSAVQAIDYHGIRLCESGDYDCIRIKRNDTWNKLWPDPYERDIVKRLNRMNTLLRTGMLIAVPSNLSQIDTMSIAPFQLKVEPPGAKLVMIDLSLLAWGAYDSSGNLIKWGPASGGRDWCHDVNQPCKTVTGSYQIYDIRGIDCFSTKYPIDEGGGAPMPYCMFFHEGYALHGSTDVPGYNASHGCVRLFIEDAQWLNEEFARLPGRTKVVVLPYDG